MNSGNDLGTLSGHTGQIETLQFSHDGKHWQAKVVMALFCYEIETKSSPMQKKTKEINL